MPRHDLVVIGHPDPSPTRLCRALANAYVEGAEEAGHAVRLFDLAALSLPFASIQDADVGGTCT